MSLEIDFSKYSNHDLDDWCAINIFRWRKDGYRWMDGDNTIGSYNHDYCHVPASDYFQRTFSPTQNIHYAFSLIDKLSGWLFTIATQEKLTSVQAEHFEYDQVEDISRLDCEMEFNHADRCRAITEACAYARLYEMENGR